MNHKRRHGLYDAKLNKESEFLTLTKGGRAYQKKSEKHTTAKTIAIDTMFVS